jgi:sortase A
MQKKSRVLWISEVSSYLIGLSLLLFAFVAWANGQLDNRLAIQSLVSLESSIELPKTEEPIRKIDSGDQISDLVSSIIGSGEVDVAKWSEKRIMAWRATLSDKGPDAFAMLSVPSAGITVPVFEGADDRNLNAGVAWIEGTDKPGFDDGNTGIAGHRDGFFRGLQKVQIGEPISLMAGGEEFVYRISDISIVEPTNVETLLPQQEEIITLVTCYPFYFVGHAPQRYVVQAVRER